MRKIYFVCLIFSAIVITNSGCDRPQTPNDSSNYDWNIVWSYEGSYDPTHGLKTGLWIDVFNKQAGYKVKTWGPDSTSIIPSSIDLIDMNNLLTTVRNFVDDYYKDNASLSGNTSPDKFSLLFGLDSVLNSGTALGVSLSRGAVNQGVSVSLVFVGIINSAHSDSKELWIDGVALHELGHARGLNADDGYGFSYDHEHHAGSNLSTCIMLDAEHGAITPTEPYNFCDFHKKVLSNCLKDAIHSTYNKDDTCTQ